MLVRLNRRTHLNLAFEHEHVLVDPSQFTLLQRNVVLAVLNVLTSNAVLTRVRSPFLAIL